MMYMYDSSFIVSLFAFLKPEKILKRMQDKEISIRFEQFPEMMIRCAYNTSIITAYQLNKLLHQSDENMINRAALLKDMTIKHRVTP